MATLMPKATAIWLIENTCLTFEQVSEFCGLHIIEVQSIADGDTQKLKGFDPIANGQLTAQNIKDCEQDPTLRLIKKEIMTADSVLNKKRRRYIAVAKRQDRPDAIAWFIKYYPDIPDSKICEMLGTTKNTIASVREKKHWNTANIKPKNPVQLGICSQDEMDKNIEKYQEKLEVIVE